MYHLTQRKIISWASFLCLIGVIAFKSTMSMAAVSKLAAPSVSTNAHSINPKVLSLALKAHRKAQNSASRKSLLTIIDYSLPSTKPRLWVMDVNKNKILYHTLVAHGKNTGDNMAKHFSDKPGSLQSSLGVFMTGNTYNGRHGTSLVLHGLEKGFNGNAARRAIVIHAAQYVNSGFANARGRLGRSWGCPALDPRIAKPVMSTIKDGSVVFIYYPDNNWLKKSSYLS